MKLKYLLSLSILISFLAFVSCDSDDGPGLTEAQRVTNLLIGSANIGSTWSIQAVDVDGVNYTDEFSDLTLTFSETGFTSENGREVFEPTDSWTFTSEAATSFTAGNQLEMAIVEISEKTLILRFTLDETIFGPGRQEAVAGENTFTFFRP